MKKEAMNFEGVRRDIWGHLEGGKQKGKNYYFKVIMIREHKTQKYGMKISKNNTTWFCFVLKE